MKILSIFLLQVYLLWSFSSVHAEEPPIKIGVMVCLSGDCADWGTAAMRGAQLAVEEVNASGGVLGRRIALKIEDTNEAVSGAKAVSAFRKLRTVDSIDIIIGPSWSPGAQAILPMVKNSKELLLITPSAKFVELARSGDHIFNISASEEIISRTLARYAYKQGWIRAAIFSSQRPAELANGRIFQDEFERLGGEVPIVLEPLPNLSELRTLATRIVATQPEVVYLSAYNNMAEAAKQLRSLGYSGPLLTIVIDQARLEAAGGSLDGVVVANSPGATVSFRETFVRRFNEEPGLSAEGGYDAVYAIAQAVEKANSVEPSRIKVEMAALTFDGASGHIRFDEHGQLIQEPVLLRAVGTNLVPLENG